MRREVCHSHTSLIFKSQYSQISCPSVQKANNLSKYVMIGVIWIDLGANTFLSWHNRPKKRWIWGWLLLAGSEHGLESRVCVFVYVSLCLSVYITCVVCIFLHMGTHVTHSFYCPLCTQCQLDKYFFIWVLVLVPIGATIWEDFFIWLLVSVPIWVLFLRREPYMFFRSILYVKRQKIVTSIRKKGQLTNHLVFKLQLHSEPCLIYYLLEWIIVILQQMQYLIVCTHPNPHIV